MPTPRQPAGHSFPRGILITVVGLGILLGLVALFIVGGRLAGAGSAAASAAPSGAPSPSASASASAAGESFTGWADLVGGECVDPYTSAWQNVYVVVDCAASHTGQLIARVPIEAGPGAPYPGEAAIVARAGLACQEPTVLDEAAAAVYADLEAQASYPISAEQWAGGQREYLCFVSRSSGEPLLGSVAANART